MFMKLYLDAFDLFGDVANLHAMHAGRRKGLHMHRLLWDCQLAEKSRIIVRSTHRLSSMQI